MRGHTLIEWYKDNDKGLDYRLMGGIPTDNPLLIAGSRLLYVTPPPVTPATSIQVCLV